ncbi:MAG: hypothetical protein K8L99_06905 [Anaerolineae bacterium]|nr:hypothetical protein [Anaerolineae bacterium]
MLNLENVKSLLGQTHIFSLYLTVDNAVRENQANTPAWEIELKNGLRRIEENLPEAQQETWASIRERINAFFDDYQPSSKGLVAFFEEDNEQIYPLPVPVEPRATFGAPLVSPLVWVLDEYEPYVVAMINQEEAAFYFSYLGGTSFEEAMEIDLEEYDFGGKPLVPATAAVVGGHKLTQGRNRDSYEAMIEEHHERFYRDVADQTEAIASDKAVHRVILAGSEQSAHEVYRLLDESWRSRVVNVLNIPLRTKVSDIFERIHPIAVNYERDQEMDLVNEVIGFAKADGRGAIGKEAVENALEMQQIETLLMSWPIRDIEQADSLVRQALLLNSQIELVSGAAAIKLNNEAEGVAAKLYYHV